MLTWQASYQFQIGKIFRGRSIWKGQERKVKGGGSLLNQITRHDDDFCSSQSNLYFFRRKPAHII